MIGQVSSAILLAFLVVALMLMIALGIDAYSASRVRTSLEEEECS